jgi:cell division protein FtsZ
VPFPVVALVGYTNAGKSTLFNRMTGAQGEAAPKQPGRAQPQVTALRQEPEPNEEQDKIEIPAFLRRQAN